MMAELDRNIPWRTSDETGSLCIDGYVFPWGDDNQPVLLRLVGSNDYFLPLFSTADKLRAFMKEQGFPYISIKQIDEQIEFLDSVPLEYLDVNLRIIVDTWKTPKQTIRFKEILRD